MMGDTLELSRYPQNSSGYSSPAGHFGTVCSGKRSGEMPQNGCFVVSCIGKKRSKSEADNEGTE